jgi:P-type Ca2+ transporter type 2C
LIAAVVSYILGESIDATVILIAVIINVVVGFFQEHKAQRALEALQKIVSSRARVRRDGRVKVIAAEELVPGDVVMLQAGDKVPADLRLLEVNGLEIAEASLTGESEPVKKEVKKLSGDLVLGDQANMAFMSTAVTQGLGLGIVVSTGGATAIGHIASLVRETKEENTPLQQKLDKFSKKLAFLVLVVSAFIFVVGILSDHELGEMFTTAVAVAVAAIPEGLVVAVTVILAVGMRRILKEQGLVKKLLAAETLGSTSVICTDKTGTLTQGEMRVASIVGESEAWKIDDIESAEAEAEYGLSLRIGVLCNNAFFMNQPTGQKDAKISGSPTEKALLLAGWQAGLDKEKIDKKYKRLDEVPFDSKIKYMMTLHKFSDTQNIVYIKGAAEKVLDFCSYVYRSKDGKSHDHLPLGKVLRLKQKKQYEKMSTSGLRVLAMAYKKTPSSTKSFDDIVQKDFIFVGFMGLQDPLRPDTKETIAISLQAGVKTVMITGDHKLTAQAIARDLGLPHESKNILTGKELAKLTASQLKKKAPQISVYARVSPVDKLKIVKAWQDRGEIVSMTGDGVNDAPALKKADIGVAVGSGTDVSKETADLILLDNDFKTIVSAIRQGRVIYDNVKKVILYFLSDSFTEMIIIVFGLLVGWPLPVLASQILWVNIVDDTFPALALTQDPEEPENMTEKPEHRKKPVLDAERRWLIAIISIVTALDTLLLFWFFWQGNPANLDHARSVAFVTLGMDSLLYIFAVRSLRRPIWRTKLFANKFLVFSVLIGIVLQALAVYVPIFQKFLRTVPLSLQDWVIIVLVSLAVIMIIEITKAVFFRLNKVKKLAPNN